MFNEKRCLCILLNRKKSLILDKRIDIFIIFPILKLQMKTRDDIVTILKDVLPSEPSTPNAPGAWYKLDAQANSVLISDKANNIKAVMNIVTALDHVEAQEKPEDDSTALSKCRCYCQSYLMNELLRTAGDANQARLGIKVQNNSTYFKKVRLVPDMRTNRLIVFGRPQAVERVRDFIHKYIDVELESGKSILHVYQLQYLDAQKFAPILKNILTSGKTGGTDQSKEQLPMGELNASLTEFLLLPINHKLLAVNMPSGTYSRKQ